MTPHELDLMLRLSHCLRIKTGCSCSVVVHLTHYNEIKQCDRCRLLDEVRLLVTGHLKVPEAETL